jgi:hypothetical protein
VSETKKHSTTIFLFINSGRSCFSRSFSCCLYCI